MDSEEWRPIPDFQGYEVSNHGRVRSFFRITSDGWIIDPHPQRILSPCVSQQYPFVHLKQRGRGYSPRIHKLVTRAFLGPRPEHMEVCHNDSNPSNNHLSNLRYDTHSNNMGDASALGRMSHPKLSDEQVIALRNARAGGALLKVLAADFGLSAAYVCQISTGGRFSDIGGPITNVRKRLSFEVAQAIRERYQPGKIAYKEIAQQYGVDISTVCRIVKNKTWKPQKGL